MMITTLEFVKEVSRCSASVQSHGNDRTLFDPALEMMVDLRKSSLFWPNSSSFLQWVFVVVAMEFKSHPELVDLDWVGEIDLLLMIFHKSCQNKKIPSLQGLFKLGHDQIPTIIHGWLSDSVSQWAWPTLVGGLDVWNILYFSIYWE